MIKTMYGYKIKVDSKYPNGISFDGKVFTIQCPKSFNKADKYCCKVMIEEMLERKKHKIIWQLLKN